MTQQTMADVDPLAGGDKTPAVSFKNKPIGTKVTMTLTEHGKFVQGKDFDTDELAYWPANADGTRKPKMCAVYTGTVDGEPMSFWATKPSSLFSAFVEAQKAAGGERMAPGGTLEVEFYAEEPAKNPKHNPRKLYRARYTKGSAPVSTADPLGTSNDPWAKPATDDKPPF